MGSKLSLALGLLSLTCSAYGIAFATPEPTITKNSLARVDDGWSPNPTQGPKFEPMKRELAGLETCGWYAAGISSTFISHDGDCRY